jgi:hypothetical protein
LPGEGFDEGVDAFIAMARKVDRFGVQLGKALQGGGLVIVLGLHDETSQISGGGAHFGVVERDGDRGEEAGAEALKTPHSGIGDRAGGIVREEIRQGVIEGKKRRAGVGMTADLR